MNRGTGDCQVEILCNRAIDREDFGGSGTCDDKDCDGEDGKLFHMTSRNNFLSMTGFK